MLELNNISYWYKSGQELYRNVSAQIAGGRIYGLLGLNGIGKTTLLKLMAGLLFPKEGEILADGTNVRERKAGTLQDLVFMPSEFRFNKESLQKFIALNSVFYPGFSSSVLNDCLAEFSIDPSTENLSRLSLGQKHKFMLSFILSLGSRHILLDEPFNGMDQPSRNSFRKLLMRHLPEESSAVISTHVMSDLANILTDVIIARNDGTLFCASLADLSAKYSFGISSSDEGALYAENCAEGYRTVCENVSGEESEIPLDILFNAVIKGVIK